MSYLIPRRLAIPSRTNISKGAAPHLLSNYPIKFDNCWSNFYSKSIFRQWEESIASPGSRFTLANSLSASRYLLAIPLTIGIVSGAWWTAAGLFVIACVTDVLDGKIARRRAESSSLGGKLDHSADAFFVSVGNAGLSYVGVVPLILAPLIVLAFIQYYVDRKKQMYGNLRASRLGKWNGIAYFVILGLGIGYHALELFPTLLGAITYWFGWLLVISTGVSIVQRIFAAKHENRTT